MSKKIDERVVSMKFDNKRFENNVHDTMNTLDKLKAKLKLTDSAKGLENIDDASKKINLSGLSDAADKVGIKFSAMQVVATTALANITNAAVSTGTRLVKSLSTDQIMAGWSKYERKTSSVQTIMNATGKSIDEVNKYLDKLMWFSDETSYGFTDMTSALGQLTSAGGDIDKLIPMITGIANATAYAGKGSEEFSRAIYNLNQSYSAGNLNYMDWKSLELAGIASKELKQIFIDTAVAMGKISEGEVTIANFGTSLKDKWADTSVMEAAFGKFSELSEEAYKMVQSGEVETASEAIEKLSGKYGEIGEKAFKSAQEAKSFTEAIDATKDAVSSGWMKTFEILFGNYEEAKVLWTGLANTLWDVFASGAEERNEMLSEWKDLGGRDDVIDSFKNIFNSLSSIVSPIKEAFRDIFPPMTAERLKNITEAIKNFTSKLTLSEKAQEKLKSTFKGLFSVIDIGVSFIKEVISGISKLVSNFTNLGKGVLGVTGSFGNWLSGIRDSVKESGIFHKVIGGIVNVLQTLIDKFKVVIKFLNKKLITPGIQGLFDFFKNLWVIVSKVGEKIVSAIVSIGKVLGNALRSGDFNAIMNVFNSGIIAGILLSIKKFVDGFTSSFEGISSIGKNVSGILNSVKGCFEAYQKDLNARVLIKIAKAIAILAVSIFVIASIDPERLMAALAALSALFTELLVSMNVFTKIGKFKNGVIKSSSVMMSMSISILILSSALKVISSIGWGDLIKGLLGMAATFGTFLSALYVLSKIKISSSMLVSASKMLVMSFSLIGVSIALKILSTISWSGLARGLIGVRATLILFVGILAVLSKIKCNASVIIAVSQMLIMTTSLIGIALVLKILSTISWEGIAKGLVAMGGTLLILTGVLAILSIFKSGALFSAAVLLVSAAAILVLSVAMTTFVGALALLSLINVNPVCVSLLKLIGVMTLMSIVGVLSPLIMLFALSLKMLGNALIKLGEGLLLLSLIDFAGMIKNLWKLLGLMSVMALLSILSPLIMLFALSLNVLGVACLTTGVGLLALSTAIVALAAVAPTAVSAVINIITTVIQAIIGLIPSIIAAIGKGIILICNTIAASIDSICSAATAIILAVCQALIDSAPKIVETIFTILDALLMKIVEYTPKFVKAVSDIIIAIVQGIADHLPRLIEAGTNIIINFINGIANGLPRVAEAAVNIVVKFLKTISSQLTRIVQAGWNLVIDFIDGMTESINTNTPRLIASIKNLFKAIINAAVQVLTGGLVDMEDSGGNLIDGFKNGITSKLSGLWDNVKDGFEAFKKKFKNFFGINSPSKLFFGYGGNLDDGFIGGINKYSDKVSNSAYGLGESAVNGISNAIYGISDVFGSDIDSQPTIRPVIDLSDVESGARSINGMFGMQPSVGVLSSVGSINSMVDDRQNGVNSDIISAIKDIGKKMANGQTNTYNINGITYDDGSNISDAIETIVREARIERRV